MDFYMYKYSCPRWYGTENDIKHIVVPENTSESKVIYQAKNISNYLTGSKSCHIRLIQKYHMLIKPTKSYPSLTQMTFNEDNKSIFILNENKNNNKNI
jgi:hypothetical protein